MERRAIWHGADAVVSMSYQSQQSQHLPGLIGVGAELESEVSKTYEKPVCTDEILYSEDLKTKSVLWRQLESENSVVFPDRSLVCSVHMHDTMPAHPYTFTSEPFVDSVARWTVWPWSRRFKLLAFLRTRMTRRWWPPRTESQNHIIKSPCSCAKSC